MEQDGSVSLTTVLGLAVSLLAVIATVAVGALRFRHERKLADIADARSILAEGALELARMKSVMKDALTKFEKPLTGQGEWPPDSLDEIHRLKLAVEDLESALAAVKRLRL
jgi:HAMP domain-containing protein